MDTFGALQLMVIVLALTGFVKIFTALTLVRYAIGLTDGGCGILVAVVSLVLAAVVPIPSGGGLPAFDLWKQNTPLSAGDAEQRFRPMLEKSSNPQLTERINQLIARQINDNTQIKGMKVEVESAQAKPVFIPFNVLAASFVITQVSDAFKIGLLLILPLVVIDLLVANIFMVLGVAQMPVFVLSLPLKLLLFIAVDGWSLIAVKLLGG